MVITEIWGFNIRFVDFKLFVFFFCKIYKLKYMYMFFVIWKLTFLVLKIVLNVIECNKM